MVSAPQLFTFDEVAALAGVPVPTVRYWTRRRGLRTVRSGSKDRPDRGPARIPEAALRRFLSRDDLGIHNGVSGYKSISPVP